MLDADVALPNVSDSLVGLVTPGYRTWWTQIAADTFDCRVEATFFDADGGSMDTKNLMAAASDNNRTKTVTSGRQVTLAQGW